MTAACTLSRAFTDKNLLGASLGDLSTWAPWLAVLKAAMAEEMTPEEQEVFASLAGGRELPKQRVQELWSICGRRSGKSRMASLLAVYFALFISWKDKLSAGETGYILVVSPSKAQSKLIRDYIEGFCRSSPILWKEVVDLTTEEIRLKGNIVISIHTSNFRTVRGRTLLCAIIEEVAFLRDETSALADVELYRSLIPALATTNGLVIGISSPYRKVGLLHQKHRDHFGKDSDVLVIQAPTLSLNPTIDKGLIARAREADPQAAIAEWDGDFRQDLFQLLPDEVIDAAIDHDRPQELPPNPDTKYFAFCDSSGGRHDAYTCCVGHKAKDDTFICDVIRARRAPFDPNEVTKEFATLVKQYGCDKITADNYSAEWVSQAWKNEGVTFIKCDKAKSQLYLECVPHFMRGAVSLPNNERMIRELRLLERRTGPSGKDRVDHPQGSGSSDDLINSVVGSLYLALTKPAFVPPYAVSGSYSSTGTWNGACRIEPDRPSWLAR